MVRGLLEGLQERIRGRLGEHVDLVDDVDLPAPWCRERRPGNEVSHRLNSVIRGCVELMDVERGTTGDVDTGVAQPAGLAVHRARAVESLGKDPRRRCLTRPPRPGEKVGVGDMVVTNGVPQGTDYVVLATDLREPLRTITPVQRLVIIHPASLRLASRGDRGRTGFRGSQPSTAGAGVRSSQVTCGTQTNPLRAAAFRP